MTDVTISVLEVRAHNLQNQFRRSNVVFFGLHSTDPTESWAGSNELAKTFGEKILNTCVSTISSAHRIGRFGKDTRSPTLAKLSSDKETDDILSDTFKLRGRSGRIWRDYSPNVRLNAEPEQKVGLEGRDKLCLRILFLYDAVFVWYGIQDKAIQQERGGKTIIADVKLFIA